MRCLITLWEGGGNVPPVLSVAAALTARGHDVRVLSDPIHAEMAERAGARHVSWTAAPHRRDHSLDSEFVRDFEPRTTFGANARLRDRLIVGPAPEFARDTSAELEREAADIIVVEALMLGSQVAAEASGLPCVSLFPNIYPGRAEGAPPYGLGLLPRDDAIGHLRDRAAGWMGRAFWDRRLGVINELRHDYGLEPVGSLFDLLERPDRVLVLTTAAFEPGGGRGVPANVRYCGPRLDDPAWVGDWAEPSGDGPLVLVSLSTTTQRQGPILPRVVEAFAGLPYRALLTTGPSFDGAALQPPPNVTVVESAPHSKVIPSCAAVMTHAGHGTTIKTLANGVPLLCMPVGRDQLDTAARVAATGAGRRIRAGSRPARIRAALVDVVSDPQYRRGAERLAAAIERDLARDLAVEEIERAADGAAIG